MNDQNEVIIIEIKDVIEEIGRLKVIIRNLNERVISRTDKHGILSFLDTKKSKLSDICNLISAQKAEVWENEGGA